MKRCSSGRLSLVLAGMALLGLLGSPWAAELASPAAAASSYPLCDPPTITAQPQSLAVCEGVEAAFTVVAAGTEPLSYQWRKDGVDISGATDSTYVIAAPVPADAGLYDVVVTNACGNATSDPATLTVDALPAISEQPGDQVACAGDAVTFTVVAEGAEPLSYQWRRDGADIEGATDSAYTIDPVSSEDAGVYEVVVANDCGQTASDPATLFVGPPAITEQPAGQSVCAGERVTLSVAALGGVDAVTTDTIGAPDNSGRGPRIRANAYAVSTTMPLTRIENYLDIADPGPIIFFVYEADDGAGPYTLIYEDTVEDAGSGLAFYASGPLHVTLEAGKYYLIGAAWPGNHTYYWGGSHPQATAFGESIGAYATSYQYPLPDNPQPSSSLVYHQRLTTTETSLAFQWRKDDVDIPGATDPLYVVEAAAPADTGDYQVLVSNDCGATSSDVATVIVADAQPTITQQPADQAACAGDEVVFTVVADGAALGYQWRKDGVDIEGATASTYTIPQASSAHEGQYDVVVSNPCGAVTSDAVTLQVDSAAPTITQQPLSQSVCDGDAVTFTVVADGDGVSYQWRKDDVDIPGATDSSYTIDPVSFADEGYYEVVVSNGCGSTPSDAATLTVLEAGPTITQQPSDADACAGEPVTFTVVAEGAALSYQWRKEGVDILDATADSYTIDAVVADDAGTYDVVVTNPCAAVTSDAATLTVGTAPTITGQPVGRDACAGDAVTFTVTASGAGLGYQWRKDDVDIPGATDASLTIDPVTAGDAGDYDVLVSNTCGAVSSDTATLVVLAAAPTITEQPAGQTACEGDQVTFTVSADGEGLGYQWRKDALDIEGATDSSYTISAVATGDAGVYDVVVSNACGAVTSDPAALTVETWPSIDGQPADQAVCDGQGASFSVTAQGTPPLSYQWRKDGVDIPGATADTYTIDAVTYDDAGQYDVVVANDCGPVTSDAAMLTVGTGAQIDVQPTGRTACEGESASFTVEASAGGGGVADIIGSAGSSNSGPRVRGNYYTVSSTTTLTRIEHYLSLATTGSLVFFVYESPAEDGPYTLIAEDHVADAGPGEGFFASGPLNVTLQAGRYYIIGTGWPGAHTYYWGGAHPQATAFGQSLYGYAGPYQDPLPGTAPYNTSSLVHHQRLTTANVTLSYQWRKDGVDIADAVEPSYTIDAVSDDDAGVYDVVVSTDCGGVTSDPAQLTVDLAPTITQPPSDQTGCVGGAVAFTVEAVGTAPLSYQWRKDEVDIDGATDSSYTIDAVTFDDAGAYDVVVSNTCGSATSAAATLSVTDAGPAITEHPVGGNYCEGDAVVLSVVAEGDGLSYQWRKDDQEIPGATDASYTLDALALGDAGDYDVVVTNPCGQDVSNAATITVAQRPAGDLDGDGVVGQGDLGLLLASWGLDDGGDLDGDADTDQADLGILLANWGASCL